MRYPLTKIKKDSVCAEVGVWEGDFSSEILSKNPRELHLIDPWIHQEFPWVKLAKGHKKTEQVFQGVLKKFQNNTRVKIHRKNSTDANFPYGYFDWVYIDADHSYDSVIKDLSHFVKFIKPGGYLCGDDYGWNDAVNGCPRGPKEAVDEFVERFGLGLEVSSNQFIIKVKRK